jgi:hypothetical protein
MMQNKVPTEYLFLFIIVPRELWVVVAFCRTTGIMSRGTSKKTKHESKCNQTGPNGPENGPNGIRKGC